MKVSSWRTEGTANRENEERGTRRIHLPSKLKRIIYVGSTLFLSPPPVCSADNIKQKRQAAKYPENPLHVMISRRMVSPATCQNETRISHSRAKNSRFSFPKVPAKGVVFTKLRTAEADALYNVVLEGVHEKGRRGGSTRSAPTILESPTAPSGEGRDTESTMMYAPLPSN